ncbi:hypothetical protein L6164_025268 [Bauhinia variegata]|uniref:Uncharacterized protein n=1 Tax=Bauhinia variegata TaxID=167791 RepID=A0ACB9LZT8_BAUVA|nr:hypothetical protein L6164_025268 [Bauhinia variegata]
MVNHHFILVTIPAQGHINPTLQFAKRLIGMGVQVTFATSIYVHRRFTKKPTVNGLSFALFSDGFDDGFNPNNDGDLQHYLSELRRRGSESLSTLIQDSANEGRPFTCLVYSILLPWAAEVARGLHLPSALLWIQPATVLDIYYYYFHDHGEYIKDKIEDPSSCIELPGLPPLTSHDLPSFLLSQNLYTFALPSFKEQLEVLDQETNPRVLVNTFEALEPEALIAVDKLNVIGIGPLIPSAFLDGKDTCDTSFGGDLFHGENDYIEWLDSKPDSSVVYVSFGTIALLSKQQTEEIARALLDSGHPFLWVIRENKKEGEDKEKERKPEEELSCIEELEEKGKIVKWCSQVEVLSHPSLGCFVTHCGWNSTIESLVSGVPVVAFPQWTDQTTNAKLIEDVWKIGVRVKVNEDGIVVSEEIRRCLDVVMESGEKREELRINAKKWREMAIEAVKEEGSSIKNLRAFVDEVAEECSLPN